MGELIKRFVAGKCMHEFITRWDGKGYRCAECYLQQPERIAKEDYIEKQIIPDILPDGKTIEWMSQQRGVLLAG